MSIRMQNSASKVVQSATQSVVRLFAVVSLSALYLSAQMATTGANVKLVAEHRYAQARDDVERGEISSTTVIIAILVLLAVTVGGIITTKITDTANNIETQ